jgi:hypothetical protein
VITPDPIQACTIVSFMSVRPSTAGERTARLRHRQRRHRFICINRRVNACEHNQHAACRANTQKRFRGAVYVL